MDNSNWDNIKKTEWKRWNIEEKELIRLKSKSLWEVKAIDEMFFGNWTSETERSKNKKLGKKENRSESICVKK